MNILGVIAEYNPFHKGHRMHIRKSKASTGCKYVIAVMSGNFVQRGEPAIVDKFCRTKMALQNGVDLVLELPVYYSCASAEYFARGAITVLDSCGVVDALCFGSESGNLEELTAIAGILAKEDRLFKALLSQFLNSGMSYPRARSEALHSLAGSGSDCLKSPNNILGIEYLKAIQAVGSHITPYTIQREGASYHSTDIHEQIPSATALRQAILNNEDEALKTGLPANCYELLSEEYQHGNLAELNNLSLLFHYMIKNHNGQWLGEISNVTEGLEHKIIKEAGRHYLLSDLAFAVKSKRYALTKIRRALLHILLELTKKEFEQMNQAGGPQYIRVLGFRQESAFLLKEIQKKGSLPLLTNIKKADQALEGLALAQWEKEVAATDLYYLAQSLRSKKVHEKNIEYRKGIIKL